MAGDNLTIPAGLDTTRLSQWACTYLDPPDLRVRNDLEKAPDLRAAGEWLRALAVSSHPETGRVRVSLKAESGWKVVQCAEDDPACKKLQNFRSVIFPGQSQIFQCIPSEIRQTTASDGVGMGGTATGPAPIISPKPYEVIRVVDLDTIVIRGPEGKNISLRFMLINGPECGKRGKSREQKCTPSNVNPLAEQGAEAARAYIDNRLRDPDNPAVYRSVTIQKWGEDHYGRWLVIVYLKDEKGNNISLNKELIEQGLGHVYIITPDQTGLAKEYLEVQQRAQQTGRGIWRGNNRYQGPVHITSFHGGLNAKNPDVGREYMRLFNITPQHVFLEGYTLVNNGVRIPLPSFTLYPGTGVQIFTHSGVTNNNQSKGPLVLNLGHPSGPVWDEKYPISVYDPQGRLVDVEATTNEAAPKIPEGY